MRRFASPAMFTAVTMAAAMAAAGVQPPPAAEATPPVKLPNMTVEGQSLADVPMFAEKEVQQPNFAPGPGAFDVQFPGRAYYEGVSRGAATVGVMLDANGHPTDYLLIRYTRPYFGDSLMRSAHEQVFIPRRVRGLAVPGPFRFTYQFAPISRISYMSSFDAITHRNEEVSGGPKFIYAPLLEREIDGGQLEATRIEVPTMPPEYASPDGKAPKVVLSLYVDERGHVRLPNVLSAPSPALIGLAVDAVQHWEFAPPKQKGQDVLVYAVRVVTFRPARQPG
jgi:hypothetical protein